MVSQQSPHANIRERLAKALEHALSEEGKRLAHEHITAQSTALYEEAPQTGHVFRINKDGTRTLGRFEGREFIVS